MKEYTYLMQLKSYIPAILFCLIFQSNQAQERVELNTLIDLAIQGNYQNKINDLESQQAEFEQKGAVEFPKTGFFFENEDYRPSDKKGEWKVGVEQEIPWPGMNKARKVYLNELAKTHQFNRQMIQAEIKRDLKQTYYELWYLQEKKNLYLQLDSIYKKSYDAATIRFNVGDVAGLDKISAEVKYRETLALLQQIDKDIEIQQQSLMLLTNTQNRYLPLDQKLEKITMEEKLEAPTHPTLLAQQQEIEVAQSMIAVQKNTNKPELTARVFSQKYLGLDDPMSGFAFGIALPIFGTKSFKNQIKALETDVEIKQAELTWQEMNLDNQKSQIKSGIERENIMLEFYEETGLQQAETIMQAANLSYKSGEIGFAELSEFMIQAIEIKENYLDSLNAYNQSMIEYQYLNHDY